MKNKQNCINIFRIMLALLLILSMIGNTLILPIVALESHTPTKEAALPETLLDGTSDTTGVPTLPEPILLTAADIPEFISAAALTERGAVERMRSEETNMSSVIFRNSDGTRTMYMYGLPVKYTSADGTVRDKSTNLVSVSTASVLLSDQPVAQTMAQMSLVQQEALQAELGILDVERAATTLHMLSTALTARQRSLSDMAYTTLDNDVYALFPTNLAKGMTLVFGEHSVRMTPAGTGMTVSAGGNVTKTTTSSLSDADVAERLLYPNVFGLGTAVQYTPTLTGVKEEILLSRNVGKNSFAFLLETGGLVLAEQSGQFVLIDPETEQQVGKLGEIIVFDSAGQVVRGNMTAQTILAGQKYGITISVAQEFLANATYPVSIDPTVTTYATEEDYYGEYTFIEDVSIYNHEDASGYTFIEWHQIGQVIHTNYQGQAAFRFPMLYDTSLSNGFSTLTSDHIASFELHLKSTSNTDASNVLKASPYVPEWPNTFKIFDSAYFGYYYISEHDVTMYSVPSGSAFSIDLTGMVKQWKDMQHGLADDCLGSPETGVLLWNGSYVGDIWLESVEYSTSIYATMDYTYSSYAGDFYMNNKATKTFLAADTDDDTLELRSGTVADIGLAITWNVEYEGGGLYSLHPNGQKDVYLDMWGELTDEKSEETMWTRSFANGGGVTWTCDDGAVLGVDDGEVVVDYPEYFTNEQMAWRMADVATYEDRELSFASIDLPQLLVGNTGKITINATPQNALWATPSDFELLEYDESATQINSETGVISAISSDIQIVTARHKVTGYTTQVVLWTYSMDDVKSIRTTRDATDNYTLCVSELYNGEKYWYQLDDFGESSDVIPLTQDNINWVHEQYAIWESGDIGFNFMYEAPYCVYQAKNKLEAAIANDQLYDVEAGSDEYYGLWIIFSLVELHYRESILLQLQIVDTISLYFDVFHEAYILANNISLLVNMPRVHTAGQYVSGIKAIEAFDDVTDAYAISDGITDTTSYAGGRPTWRQSETYAGATRFNVDDGYLYNPSYKLDPDGNFTKVNWGDPGSVRPDYYNPQTGHCVDIKNYTVTTTSGKNNLINNVVTQYNTRVNIFPSGTTFEVVIDVRGQSWTQEILDEIVERITSRTNGQMTVSFFK